MTEEELEKKAEEYAINNSCKKCNRIMCDFPSEYCKWYKSVFEIAKENEELKKDKEHLDKVNNEQTEIILKLDEQIEKLTKMLDMAIDDIYNETLVIHRTREEFIDIYKSNLENKIMGETKDESISL